MTDRAVSPAMGVVLLVVIGLALAVLMFAIALGAP